jgi:DNA adenine methylase
MSGNGRSMSQAPVRPVLKWVGGKSRSLPHILGEFPDKIGTYYEPFIGGAAVFFALATARRFKRAVLSDRNPALIDVYRALKKDADSVIAVLKKYRYERDEYYRIRALDPGELGLPERAARVIYLNKTGYNGLYRVNSRGEFNVPFGRYKNPNFCDESTLRAAATVLKNVQLHVDDFESTCLDARRGDAVYFDPPYHPVSKTANFTAYHKVDFGEDEHHRLGKVFAKLAARGVTVVLSNSDTKFTRGVFSSFPMKKIAVTRPINSKASGRGAVYELLVTSAAGSSSE